MSFVMSRPSRRVRDGAARAMLCGLFLLALGACQQKAPQQGPPPPKVTVSQPAQRSVVDYLELTGNTQAINTVQLVARVEGYLDKVFFQDGDTVKKDQLLFLIQQNTYLARLQQAEGAVQQQKTLLEHAKIEYARYSDLVTKKAASQQDLENWRYQRDSAQAALMTAEAQRDQARLDFGYTWVTAPFTGRIDRRLTDPRNLVSPTVNTVLAALTQMDPLYVYFTVSEADVARLFADIGAVPGRGGGSKHPVYMGLANEEGYPHEGYLDFASPTVSTATGTLLARGVFANADGKILPGQFARVKTPIGKEKPALLLPQMAVGFDQQGSFVLLVGDKDVAQRRNVKKGAIIENMYVIEEGLKGDEWVIVKGLPKTVPGKPVTPERQGAEQQPGRPSGAGPSQGADRG